MIFILFLFQLFSTTDKISVDWILHHGIIYTVDSNFSIAEAMAIHDGKIVEVGSDELILGKYMSEEITDLKNLPVYPGFIDPHCHFLYYGIQQSDALLYDTKSFNEVILIVQKHDYSKTGGWIIGSGWDQNDWEIKEFPDCRILDSIFPDIPVYLKRVDGHAALANTKALELAGINTYTSMEGGLVKTQGEKCTGILIDNAMLLIENILPTEEKSVQKNALLEAQEKCFQVGITSVHDAGISPYQIEIIQDLQNRKILSMRINAMVSWSEENYQYFLKKGKIETDYLNVQSFKCYQDGALGSRGAALLEPYSDDRENKGLLFMDYDSLLLIAQKIYRMQFQMCTHAIGDKANRQVLKVYGEVLAKKNDLRWRVEHCQIIHPYDFELFTLYSILPSIQATHATSDMYWADERLGDVRMQNAYAYKKLLTSNQIILNGSDFPVENINPLYGFYAAVERKDLNGIPINGFQIENALTKMEALKAMTIWAAFAAFQEEKIGSIESGKFADFVILDQDIMQIANDKIPQTKVLFTVTEGEIKYQK